MLPPMSWLWPYEATQTLSHWCLMCCKLCLVNHLTETNLNDLRNREWEDVTTNLFSFASIIRETIGGTDSNCIIQSDCSKVFLFYKMLCFPQLVLVLYSQFVCINCWSLEAFTEYLNIKQWHNFVLKCVCDWSVCGGLLISSEMYNNKCTKTTMSRNQFQWYVVLIYDSFITSTIIQNVVNLKCIVINT